MANKKKPLKKQKIRNAEYYDMQTAFDKLYADSVSGRQFRNLVELIQRPENIMLAYRNLRKNSGSKTAGVDKKTISDLNKWSDKKLVNHVQRKLDWYVPNAVRRVEIPKDNGKKRPLGIPTIMDRLIQQCILQVLEPICEAKFFKRSNGFRPTHSAENAIAQAERMIQNIGCYYVIDIDIHGFFDNVNHGKLLKQMWALGIRDKKLLSIISAMLKAEVAGIGFPEKGTPQGGIISPLLSNIVLNELDWWVASQWEEMPTKRNYVHRIYANGTPDKSNTIRALRIYTKLKECYLVRYADDFKIFCKKHSDAVKLFEATKQWLWERLGLEISPEKSKIVNVKRHYSEFLGFKLRVREKGKKPDGSKRYVIEAHVRDKALKKIRARSKEIIGQIRRTYDPKMEYRLIQKYNSYLIGIAVAKNTGCAIVIIAHMNKMRDTNPLYRTNGSIDIAGAARSILAITRTPNKEAPAERYMVQVKSNLAPTGSAILFEVAEKGVDFISEMEMTAEEAFQSLAPKMGRPNDKEIKAKEFLLEMLKDGEMLSSDCEERLEAAGFKKSTIKKAKKKAGVISKKKGFLWYWSLPMGDIPRE